MARTDTVAVEWEVEDGYAGGRRPQKAYIHLSDLEDCGDEIEVRSLFASTIQEAFENKCGPGWEKSEEDSLVEKWKELKAAEQA